MSRKRQPSPDQDRQIKTTSTSPSEYRNGLVISRFGAKLDVEDDNGQIHRCTSRRKQGAIVCGDRVTWEPGHDNEGVIVERLPRDTFFARPDDIGREKAIAANITRLIIVSAVKSLSDERYCFHDNMIDRYIVAAESLGITPVLVINKIDLLNAEEREQLGKDVAPYNAVGYQVLYTSTKEAHGLDPLTQQLVTQTSIFVGESGVGKSSIIGTLLSDADVRVGEVSSGSGKGKHTTTAARLYHLAAGGDLIDSPGVREFGFSQIEPDVLTTCFIEFRPFIGHCKFNNCLHHHEPGCAIKTAVENGKIDTRRYGNYLNILGSIIRPAP